MTTKEEIMVGNRGILRAAMGATLGGYALGSWALNAGDVLEFDPGKEECLVGGVYPYCEFGLSRVVSGSYFAFDLNGNGRLDPEEQMAIAPGPDGGVVIGVLQAASGSHAGCPDGSEA